MDLKCVGLPGRGLLLSRSLCQWKRNLPQCLLPQVVVIMMPWRTGRRSICLLISGRLLPELGSFMVLLPPHPT